MSELVQGFQITDAATVSVLEGLTLLAGGLLLVGLPLFVVELLVLARRGALVRPRVLGMLTSAFCLVPATLAELGLGAGLLGLYAAAGAGAILEIPTAWTTALVCLVLVDLGYYVEHRLAHEVNALWASYHSVHHSADHYDQTIGLRVSFVDLFFSPLIYLPVVLIGFHPALVLACFGVVLAWQQWIHTELVGKLPGLDGWLNTPSNHRVHHGRNPRYIDKNYGGILIVWDRLFGTWEPEVETPSYGLVHPLELRDPISVHGHVVFGTLRRLARASTLRQRLAIVFGPPS